MEKELVLRLRQEIRKMYLEHLVASGSEKVLRKQTSRSICRGHRIQPERAPDSQSDRITRTGLQPEVKTTCTSPQLCRQILNNSMRGRDMVCIRRNSKQYAQILALLGVELNFLLGGWAGLSDLLPKNKEMGREKQRLYSGET